MKAGEDEVDDRYAGIDIDSLMRNRTVPTTRMFSYGSKRALYEAPEFLRRLTGEETVMEGQSIVLECKVVGFPVPTLKWYKDSEQLIDHPRIFAEGDGKGGYSLYINKINKGDEAAYRCRAENIEGACSCCFFLSVKAKRKKKNSKGSAPKRTVSFPPMFATIVEKVEEEEKEGKELEGLELPAEISDVYYAMTLKGRQSWPTFLGDWAYANAREPAEQKSDEDSEQPPNKISQAKRSLRRSDLAARVEAKKRRMIEEEKQKEAEEKSRKEQEEKQVMKEKEYQKQLEMERNEEREKEERRKREEAMEKRKKMREERIKKQLKEEEEREQERKRLEEEKRLKEERLQAEKQKLEEERLKEELRKKKMEEMRREDEERIEKEKKRKLLEEEKRKEEEARKEEEEKKRIAEEAKKEKRI